MRFFLYLCVAMIQRIQSIYLFIVFILSVVQCFYPFASVGEMALGVSNCVIYAGISVIIPLMAIVSFFMFKKRILQMRLCSFNVVLMVFQILSMVGYFYFATTIQETEEYTKHILLVFALPFINIILTYLAVRAIGKDEALVRSLDRLR